MKKLVKLLGLSYSQTQIGSYVVILSEIDGQRKLPLIIKPSDAQQIALKMEGIKAPRPLTHDLIKSVTDTFNIDIQEVYIYSILEGIFYTRLYTTNGIESLEIECTAGDGISLSLVYNCPIYVSSDVLDTAGIIINDDGTLDSNTEEKEDEIKKEDKIDNIPSKRIVTIENLEKMMEAALENEEYEIAAEIRDRITKLKEKKGE
jgi:hypothetical protein